MGVVRILRDVTERKRADAIFRRSERRYFNLVEKSQDIIEVGARVALEELREFCRKPFPEFAELLNVFASPQIKNVATLVGNVANGSPIGDMPEEPVSEGRNLKEKRPRTIPRFRLIDCAFLL